MYRQRNKRKQLPKKTSHISLAHQITLVEGILTEEEINSSPPCSQEPHEDNVPEVVLMAALGLRRCHGCKGEILKQHCQPPKDLVFRMQALWIWRQKGHQEWQQHYGNVYFHLKNHACGHITANFQLKMLPWLLTHLHYFLQTTCAFFTERTYSRQYFKKSKSSKYLYMIILIHIPFKFMVSLTNMLPLNSLFIFQTLFAQREIK